MIVSGIAVAPVMSVSVFRDATSFTIGTHVCCSFRLFFFGHLVKWWNCIVFGFLWRCLSPHFLLLGRLVSILLPLLLPHVWNGRRGMFCSKNCVFDHSWCTLVGFFGTLYKYGFPQSIENKLVCFFTISSLCGQCVDSVRSAGVLEQIERVIRYVRLLFSQTGLI